MPSDRNMPFAILALSFSVVLLPTADSLSGGKSGMWSLWEGTLDTGSLRYKVGCMAYCPTGGMPVAEVTLAPPEQPAMSSNTGQAFPSASGNRPASRRVGEMPTYFLADTGLTESEIKANGYLMLPVPAVGAAEGAWWESTNTVELLDDLPVRVRLFYEVCEGTTECERFCVSRIVVYSMGEWNNRLNDNLVLRLEHVGGNGQCAKQSVSQP